MGASFNALWTGQSISLMGDYIAYYTVPRYVLELSDRASAFTTIFAIENIPTLLFGFLGGFLIDRKSRRAVAMYSDLWRAVAFAVLAYLASTDSLEIWMLAAISFVIGTLAASFNAALLSFVPAVVGIHRLTTANARLAISQQIAFVIGPLVGASILEATQSFTLTFAINGATFVVSAISLLVARPLIRQARSAAVGFREEIISGLRYLWNDRVLRTTAIAASAANLVVGFIEPTLVLVARRFLGLETDSQIKWVFLALSIGGVFGALTATRISRRIGLGRTFVVGFVLFAAGLFVLATAGPLLAVLTGLAVGFVGLPWLNVANVTIRQMRSPEEMLGRITAASRAIAWGSLPVGAIIGGYLADEVLSLNTVLLIGPIWIGLVAVWLRFSPVWSMDSRGSSKSDVSQPQS